MTQFLFYNIRMVIVSLPRRVN